MYFCLLHNLNECQKGYEIIVVDDCSTDDTIDVVSRNFPDVKITRNMRNFGAAYTKKEMKNTSSNILVFADDYAFLQIIRLRYRS